MSQFESEASDQSSSAWQRPAEEVVVREGPRPKRAQGRLEGRTIAVQRPMRSPLRRRGPKTADTPVKVPQDDPGRGAWTRAHAGSVPPNPRKRRRAVPITRDMLSGEERPKWIRAGQEIERSPEESNLIVRLETWIFGNPEVAEGSWKRPPAEPEAREFPLPPARLQGELKGRPRGPVRFRKPRWLRA